MKKVLATPFTILLMVALTSLACNSKYQGFDKTANGLYYKLYKVSTDTVKPRIGDYITLEARQYYKDSLVFDSKVQMGGKPIRFQLPGSDFKGDLMEGLQLMSPGDSAIFIIPVDSLFKGRQLPPKIDSNTVFYFHINLISIATVEDMKKKEVEDLAKYLSDNNITVQPTESGLYYIEEKAGSGIKIDTGCQVTYNVAVRTIDGTEVFKRDSLEFIYGKKPDVPGFLEGISKMKNHGKATLVLPSKIAFGERGYRDILPYTPVIYEVEVVNVRSKADYEKEQAEKKKQEEMKKANSKKNESLELQKYLKEHNITVKPTADGLYYIEMAKGTGPQAMPGKKVSVHYTGTLLNGKKFDSSRDRNEPFEFELGKGQVIKGWDEGIAMMKKGGKATLIIPSSIGYGDRDMGEIPPYSTLVFDVELIDVK